MVSAVLIDPLSPASFRRIAIIAAEPLERAVLNVLREVLTSRPDMRSAVERALKKRSAEHDDGSNDRGTIERELH